jgi:L-ascorbate metabolism protein UlaG (beta-lactamase superfamily)
VHVLLAHHDGRRSVFEKGAAPALGFRIEREGSSVWYPGDTGVGLDVDGFEASDLATVPIGGWGPSLGDDHLDPEEAATLVARVGARWALAVHYGTFWPLTQRRAHKHQHFFVTPPERFRAAMAGTGIEALTPAFGQHLSLDSQRTRWTRPSSQTGSSDS